ncbi:hypothetical protein KR786_001731 [Enterococcus faecium]|uniref:hypothetical protein n=1 Tax=Enterococcus faecium TaxID=1352 RepID=UPI001E0B548C|nr:hypothetical protein [Enterococcus faecium]
MLKDKRKTKENSKNQEQYINYIKEYFAEAPIKISNDKTKLFIIHNDYPITLENTSIIERFTNKNKGIEFTKEQAIREAERLRNELAVEVKNYKAVEIELMQNLIKQYFNLFFTYKKCDRNYQLVFDNNYPYKFRIQYKNKSYDFDFKDLVSEFLADKRLVDIPFIDVSEFSEAITVDKMSESRDYIYFVYELLGSIVSNIDGYCNVSGFKFDGRNLTFLHLDIIRSGDVNAYNNFRKNVNYLIKEVELLISKISDEYEVQEECAKFAEVNYKRDIEKLITNLESEIKIKYPDFKINDKYIHASNFNNSDFSASIKFDNYNFLLDINKYDVFNQSGFVGYEDITLDFNSKRNYCYKTPYVNKFNYRVFLEVVKKELNKVKEEILEDLSK